MEEKNYRQLDNYTKPTIQLFCQKIFFEKNFAFTFLKFFKVFYGQNHLGWYVSDSKKHILNVQTKGTLISKFLSMKLLHVLNSTTSREVNSSDILGKNLFWNEKTPANMFR